MVVELNPNVSSVNRNQRTEQSSTSEKRFAPREQKAPEDLAKDTNKRITIAMKAIVDFIKAILGKEKTVETQEAKYADKVEFSKKIEKKPKDEYDYKNMSVEQLFEQREKILADNNLTAEAYFHSAGVIPAIKTIDELLQDKGYHYQPDGSLAPIGEGLSDGDLARMGYSLSIITHGPVKFENMDNVDLIMERDAIFKFNGHKNASDFYKSEHGNDSIEKIDSILKERGYQIDENGLMVKPGTTFKHIKSEITGNLLCIEDARDERLLREREANFHSNGHATAKDFYDSGKDNAIIESIDKILISRGYKLSPDGEMIKE